jgi:ketosteroid isomerase-like protein
MFLVTLLFLAMAAPAPQEAAIKKVLSDQTSAWNRGDIEAFMQGYENSPETTFIGKTVQHGWQQVLDNYRVRYPTREAMAQLNFSDLSVKMLGENYASVTGRFHLSTGAEGIFSLVFRKTPAGWKIILDHTS